MIGNTSSPACARSRLALFWNRRGEAREKGFEGLQLHGVEFTLWSAPQKSRHCALLAGEGFVEVFRPSPTEFDFLQNALAGERDELGSKMRKPRARYRN